MKEGKRQKLGQILKLQGIISGPKLVKALDQQKLHGGKLGEVLVAQGLITEEQLTIALHEQWRIPIIDFDRAPFNSQAIRALTQNYCVDHMVLPVTFIRVGGKPILVLAMENPSNHGLIEQVHQMTNFPIKPMLAGRFRLIQAISDSYQNLKQSAQYPYV